MYEPGDLLVIPSPDAFIVGRILHTKPHGPWWEQVASKAEYFEAARLARMMAAESGRRAWVFHSAQQIDELGRAAGTGSGTEAR